MEEEEEEKRKEKVEVAPQTASGYLDPAYWDLRFSAEDHYEWFKDYSHFRHLLHRYIRPTDSVLELGCGNSRLCEELSREGLAADDITCTDLSPIAVQRMQSRLSAQNLQGIKVLEADMLDLPFSSECFDVVIEKGTMVYAQRLQATQWAGSLEAELQDVLFVDSGDPWKPNLTTVNKVMKMLEGVHNVLKPEGIFISISFGQPHFRRPLFEAPAFTWSVSWDTFGDGFHYFFYILKKGRKALDSRERPSDKCSVRSINLLHEELDEEDYIFRTAVDVMED